MKLAVFETEGNSVKFNVQTEGDSFVKETATFQLRPTQQPQSAGHSEPPETTAGSSVAYAATYWRPKNETVSAGVFIVHGFAEYIGASYEELARFLCRHDVFVFGHDHVGHGRSSGMRVQADSMDDFVEPVVAHVTACQSWSVLQGRPIFILGHSMGGLITLFTLLKSAHLFRGAIFMGPLVMVDPSLASPVIRLAARMAQMLLPTLVLGKLKADLITRDKEQVQRIEQDELFWHGGFRARLAHVLMNACTFMQNHMDRIELPVLVLQGEKDSIVMPEGARLLHERAKSADKTLIMYPDAFHHLFVEQSDVKLASFQATLDWLKTR